MDDGSRVCIGYSVQLKSFQGVGKGPIRYELDGTVVVYARSKDRVVRKELIRFSVWLWYGSVYPGHDYGGSFTTIGLEKMRGMLKKRTEQQWVEMHRQP